MPVLAKDSRTTRYTYIHIILLYEWLSQVVSDHDAFFLFAIADRAAAVTYRQHRDAYAILHEDRSKIRPPNHAYALLEQIERAEDTMKMIIIDATYSIVRYGHTSMITTCRLRPLGQGARQKKTFLFSFDIELQPVSQLHHARHVSNRERAAGKSAVSTLKSNNICIQQPESPPTGWFDHITPSNDVLPLHQPLGKALQGI